MNPMRGQRVKKLGQGEHENSRVAEGRWACATSNQRGPSEGWRGHLWQGRFASFVLDEPYVLTAARYVELNPVRAGWSTPRAVIGGAARLPMCEDRTTHSFRSLPCSSWRHLGVGFSRGSFAKRTSNSCVLTSKPYLSATRSFWRRSKKTRILRRQKPGPKPRPARNPKRPTRGPQPQRRNCGVEVWRGGFRLGLSVSGPFGCRCLTSFAIAPFPHPAHQTGRAVFPHPAFGQGYTHILLHTFAHERLPLCSLEPV